MPDSRLAAALARGALVVTPNKRLARDVVLQHDRRQRADGRSAWTAARAMPWPAFMAQLWQAAADAGASGLPDVQLLDPAQSAFLWQRVLARDLADQPLVDRASAAACAMEAWERVHAYGSGDSDIRRFGATGGADAESFARWASAFRRESSRLAAIDAARAADILASMAASLPRVEALDVACAGFLEHSPQKRRLLDALQCAGAQVEELGANEAAIATSDVAVHTAATPRDEWLCALAWARERAAADPCARVAVVVPDLAQSRDSVRSLAEDILCPGLLWPGREREPRPYDLSAGRPLDVDPVAGVALDLVALAHGPLPVARAATLLRSRCLPGDRARRARRASLERAWMERGRREVSLRALVAELSGADADLGERWRPLIGMRVPSQATPREFADFWRGWLEVAGWCAGDALSPGEREARGAWSEVLAAFPRLATITSRMDDREALAALREAIAAKTFQPEAPGARIQILGLLEATGLAFDAVWITGLSADAWPRSPEPNPLLPLAWQREHGVPRSTPERELAYARLVTEALARSAPLVVLSHAERIDDHASLPSPLIASFPRRQVEVAAAVVVARSTFAARPALLDAVDDAIAPAYESGTSLTGGAGLIESFSACPFQAAARYRLRAEPWPEDAAGLPPPERGKMIHAALAAFWRDVADHRGLRALGPDELDARIASAVAAGRSAIDAVRWDAIPAVVAAEESAFVARLMRSWIEGVEMPRPPFAVVAIESDATLDLAGHPMRLRVDRVDRLDDGRAVILDYKTGEAVAPERWFDERPQGPQLALYAMAGVAGQDVPLAGLAYAQLKAGRVRPVGLAADALAWPALATPATLRGAPVADWDAAAKRLFENLDAIGHAVASGDARIAPREAAACNRCGLHALCRIAAWVENGDDGNAEDRDDA